MPSVDPSARVHPDARLADDVTVHAGATVEAGVTIGAGSHIGFNAVLYTGTEVGEQVTVGVGAVLGGPPQDLKFAGGERGGKIGARTVVREYVTVQRGVEPGGVTVVGSDCLLMATSHVAHECVLGDAVIVTNGVMLAGHVAVGSGVFLSGNVVVRQFTRIGRLAMIGGGGAVRQDVVPFCVADGHPARPLGLNTVGLQRAGFSTATVRELKRAYRILFSKGTRLADRLDRLAQLAASDDGGSEEIAELCAFVEASERGVARPR